MTDRLAVLRASVEHLRHVIDDIEAFDPDGAAYPTEWTIADTMSHIGSGATIMKQNLENAVAGREGDPGFNQSVWDEWNAKSPTDQVNDALVADEKLLLSLEALSESEKSAFHFSMGPFDLDFDGFVGLRLNEQAVHTWDVEVAVNPSATLSDEVAGAIIDNLQLIIRFAGKARGEVKEMSVRTTNPARDFMLVFADDAISMGDSAHSGDVDLELPAEAFVRLVYGRLDADNAPAGINQLHLEDLRKAFPGF
jgi:uncharacterized protein (TIGR03083 family)